mmetsp:Transcript_154374/g.272593  ORF Transcript_154374/g.272593 Transcript_154374/m.272593 type:complete len:203 (+) Transcript_154374:80-688(+)
MSVSMSMMRNKAAVAASPKSSTLATTKTASTPAQAGSLTLKTPPATPARTSGSLRADVPTPVKTINPGSLSARLPTSPASKTKEVNGSMSARDRAASPLSKAKEASSPVKSTGGSIRAGSSSPTRREPTSPRPEEVEQVIAWQNDVDTLEAKQVELQNSQMNLLHNQIHILTRELGDLQNKFVRMQTDMTTAMEEAHSALRL